MPELQMLLPHNMVIYKIMTETHKEIVDQIKQLYVDCPECEYMFSDSQYTCATCWCEGGGGQINVLQWLKEHKDYLADSK